MTAANVVADLKECASPVKARVLRTFFKTGKGEYGEGDIFLGVTVPKQRKIAQQYESLSLLQMRVLFGSQIHECRLTALLILVHQFTHADPARQKILFDFYLANRSRVNNWDLVDSSAPRIVGAYLLRDTDCAILVQLARSRSLWDRRIAVVATLAIIRSGRFDMTLSIAELLLDDTHDLIHKAVGWMLREMGKKDEKTLTSFLNLHRLHMPRTMLRYAIERYSADQRRQFLSAH